MRLFTLIVYYTVTSKNNVPRKKVKRGIGYKISGKLDRKTHLYKMRREGGEEHRPPFSHLFLTNEYLFPIRKVSYHNKPICQILNKSGHFLNSGGGGGISHPVSSLYSKPKNL